MKKYRHAVSVCVLRPGKDVARHELLLVHKPRLNDAWQLPQGGVEPGETVEQAALRELWEETGLQLGPVEHVSRHTYTYDFPPEFLKRYNPENAGQKLSFVLLTCPSSSVPKADEKEIDSYVWILPDQLGAYIKRGEYEKVIRSVLKEFERVVPDK